MFHPQYESGSSGVDQSHFAPQQNISVSLDNTVGNTIIDKTEINVKYSFGRPVISETPVLLPLLEMENFSLLGTEDLPSIDADKSNTTFDFKPLEKAPEGNVIKLRLHKM
ncbi:MAG: hypothetical protein ACI8WT_001684 [Clostridium sp.]|jgi:hypothetical protein